MLIMKKGSKEFSVLRVRFVLESKLMKWCVLYGSGIGWKMCFCWWFYEEYVIWCV